MRWVVIYYDGNETKAKYIGLTDEDYAGDMTPFGLGLMSPDDSVTAIIEVQGEPEFMFQGIGADGTSLVITYSSNENTHKVLDFEDIGV